MDDVIYNGIDRNLYPKNMRGSLAKNLWNNAEFTLGIEYGYIYKVLKDNEMLEKGE